MKPMLAHRFNDHQHRVTYPVFIQPKLNGIRGIYNHGTFQSRDEILWHPDVLSHLVHELLTCTSPDQILDGELYLHGCSLQKINGAVSINRKSPDTFTPNIEYHVFDIIDLNDPLQDFTHRAVALADLSNRLAYHKLVKVKVVPTLIVTQPEAEQAYLNYRQAGYEGIMYRHPFRPYGFVENCGNQDNRWTSLLKRKAWMDDEFEIVDFKTTIGEKGNRGFQLTCKTKQGHLFEVGSGLAAYEVDECEQNPPIGRQARVRYEMLSDGLKPLKPTLEAIL